MSQFEIPRPIRRSSRPNCFTRCCAPRARSDRRWIALDTAADIFVVNERDRSQVRQCISLLRGVALEIDTAVILLAHPSLSGISSGTGLSGSTAWNNSVRSRLYLKTEKKKNKDDEEEEQEDGVGVRILEFMKSNYSALAAPVRLKWENGLLVPEQTLARLTPIDRAHLDEKARAVFVTLLTRYNRNDWVVSRKEKSNNYAPKEFLGLEEALPLHPNKDQRRKLLRQAMEYLLQKERIHTGMGPKSVVRSQQNVCLYVGASLLWPATIRVKCSAVVPAAIATSAACAGRSSPRARSVLTRARLAPTRAPNAGGGVGGLDHDPFRASFRA